jgi:hypothetical protein
MERALAAGLARMPVLGPADRAQDTRGMLAGDDNNGLLDHAPHIFFDWEIPGPSPPPVDVVTDDNDGRT